MKVTTNSRFGCLVLSLWLASFPAALVFAVAGKWVPLIGSLIITGAGAAYFRSVWIDWWQR